jgi:hypothetical protein
MTPAANVRREVLAERAFGADRRGRAALWLAAALLSAATIWFGLGPHDEGLMLQAARRIADGQLPYRDFWWNYGPGQPYLLSPFGGSLVAWRVIRVALDATVALLAYELAARLIARARDGVRPAGAVVDRPRWLDALPLLAWVAVAGAMAFPTGPGPNPAALALGLGALLLAPRHVAVAGILAGLAAVFRIEIGVAAALGVAIAGAPRALAWAAGTAVLGWLPFLIAAPGDLIEDTLGFLGVQGMQRRPFPLDPSGVGLDPNKLLELWLPAILVIGCALWLVRRTALVLAPLLVVSLAYLLGRTDEFHLVPLAVVLPIALVAAAAAERVRALRIAALAVVGLIALHGLERKAGELLHLPATAPIDGVRGEAAEVRAIDATLAAIDGRSIYVVPPRTDRLTVGNPLLYVLAGADNPTRYDVMQPGVVTERDVQEEIIADLERARPQMLVRWLDPRTAPEDNASGRERGSTLLDAYLRRTYGARPRRFGPFEVSERR